MQDGLTLTVESTSTPGAGTRKSNEKPSYLMQEGLTSPVESTSTLDAGARIPSTLTLPYSQVPDMLSH